MLVVAGLHGQLGLPCDKSILYGVLHDLDVEVSSRTIHVIEKGSISRLYLESEHKHVPGVGSEGVEGRVVALDGGGTGVDGRAVEGLPDHAEEPGHHHHDDGQAHQPSRDGAVLRVLPVAQHLRGVEHVHADQPLLGFLKQVHLIIS